MAGYKHWGYHSRKISHFILSLTIFWVALFCQLHSPKCKILSWKHMSFLIYLTVMQKSMIACPISGILCSTLMKIGSELSPDLYRISLVSTLKTTNNPSLQFITLEIKGPDSWSWVCNHDGVARIAFWTHKAACNPFFNVHAHSSTGNKSIHSIIPHLELVTTIAYVLACCYREIHCWIWNGLSIAFIAEYIPFPSGFDNIEWLVNCFLLTYGDGLCFERWRE